MSPLPLPVRLAAGLVATAVEQARDLPKNLIQLPVTAVSQALQASMRVQQTVTELAIKGDKALSSLRPVEESPAWATFDDEEPPRNGSVTAFRPSRRTIPVDRPETVLDEMTDPVEEQLDAVEEAERAVTNAVEETPDALPAAEPDTDLVPAAAPPALPNYDELTIPQLRARLRTLTVDDLRALLAWEESHQERPPFLTMLSNRITTVTEAVVVHPNELPLAVDLA